MKPLQFNGIAVVSDVDAFAEDGGCEATAFVRMVEDFTTVVNEPEPLDGGACRNVFADRLDAMMAGFHEQEVAGFVKPWFQLADVPDIA